MHVFHSYVLSLICEAALSFVLGARFLQNWDRRIINKISSSPSYYYDHVVFCGQDGSYAAPWTAEHGKLIEYYYDDAKTVYESLLRGRRITGQRSHTLQAEYRAQ